MLGREQVVYRSFKTPICFPVFRRLPATDFLIRPTLMDGADRGTTDLRNSAISYR